MSCIAIVVIIVVIIIIIVICCGKSYKGNFVPSRVDPCSSKQDVMKIDKEPDLHQWPDMPTSYSPPYSVDSKLQLVTSALSPSTSERHMPVNPITNIGKGTSVMRWDNPYYPPDTPYYSPCSDVLSPYEKQPWQTGFMIKKDFESTDGTKYRNRYYYQPMYSSYASGPYGGPYTPLFNCSSWEK